MELTTEGLHLGKGIFRFKALRPTVLLSSIVRPSADNCLNSSKHFQVV